MKSLSTVPLLLLVLAALLSSVSAISFTVDTASCDGDPFDNLDLTTTCTNSATGATSSSCGFGDNVSIGGTVEATESFSDSNVVLSACILSTYCPEKYERNAGSLCDNWLTAADGQECGAIGKYTIAAEERIPEADIGNAMSWMVTVTIGLQDECTAETTTSSSSYGTTYSGVGLVSLALGAAAFVARRRRGVDESEEDADGASRFVEMTDSAAVV